MAGRDRNVNEITVTSNYTVPVEMDYVYADATAGAITVTLKRTKDKLIRRQIVVKIDSSANAVTVTDGTLSVDLVTQDDAGIFEQKGTGQFFMSAANLAGAATQIAAGQSLTYSSTEYNTAGSFQPIGVDLNLGTAAGTSAVGDSDYLSPIMGNIVGAALTKTKNIIAGIIGKLSVTGVRASTYPVAGVIGEVGDGVTESDGAFVAVIGGDSAQTKGRAAYAIDNQNSVPGSGFDWFLDAYHATHDGYPAVAFLKGLMRIATMADGDLAIFFGTATDDAGIVAQVGADALWADGSLYISAVQGAGLLFQKRNDVWISVV